MTTEIKDTQLYTRMALLTVAEALGIYERESLRTGDLLVAICDEARRLKAATKQAPQPWRDG